MGYVENNLMSNEKIIYKAKTHWIIFVVCIFLIFFGSALLASEAAPVGILILLYGFYDLCKALITKYSTELVVTNKRVIAKVGFIRRLTIELNHGKVEGLMIDQSIVGRILDYGTLFIAGTGGQKTPVPMIDSPLKFRKAALEVIDIQQSK